MLKREWKLQGGPFEFGLMIYQALTRSTNQEITSVAPTGPRPSGPPGTRLNSYCFSRKKRFETPFILTLRLIGVSIT